jgi:signal recognition particle subunit SRP54
MIPGLPKTMRGMGSVDFDEKELVKVEAIINSMTPKERANYQVINGSRRLRIARGSGTSVQDINRLLKQYAQARKMMKQFSKMGEKGLGRGRTPFFS